MEKCAIYTRVSSQRQTKGKSIEVQKEQGISYCKNQSFHYEILDEGAASSKYDDLKKRPQMENLLDKVEDGRFQYVYVIDFDRLSRNEIVTATIKQILRENDVKLIVGNTEYDLQDEDRDMVAGLLGQFAILENRKRAKKSVKSRRLMVEQGYISGFRPAYGYKIVGEKTKRLLALDEEKAKVVRLMADLVLEGKTLGGVAQILAEKGIPAPTKKSKCWQSFVVGQILRSATIIGKIKLTGNRINEDLGFITCAAIISEEEQEQIKEQLRRNMRVVESKRKHDHYFRYGKAKCKRCGKTFLAQFTYYETKRGLKRCFRLACQGRRKAYEGGVGCGMPNLDGQEISRVIWWETAALLQNPRLLIEEYKKQIIVEDAKMVNIVSAFDEYDNEIADKKKQISKLLDDRYILNTISVEHLNAKIREWENEIEALEEKRKSLKEQLKTISNLQSNVEKINEFLNNLKVIHRLTEKEKIRILDLLIKNIEVDYDNGSKKHIVTIVYRLPIDLEQQDLEKDLEKKNFWQEQKSLDY
ncbi:recombinase family protein [candidate division KSB1 bacterium]|nr:recombinase family protein [candidate division KSB1 bacterium]